MLKDRNGIRRLCLSGVCAISLLVSTNVDGLLGVARAADRDVQRRSGYFADNFMTRSEGIIYDEELDRWINLVGLKLVESAERLWPETKDFKFTFRVINSPDINAGAVSGGVIYIYSGLLDQISSKDELAVVIGHEIGHTIRGHFTQAIEDRDRTVKIIGFAGALLGIAAGAAIRTGSTNSSGSLSAGGVLAGTVAAMAVGAGLGFTSFALSKAILEGYAQENEFEADEMDVAIVRGAGYDPRALISLMKKFAYLEQSVEALRQKAKIEHWKQETTHFLNAKPGLTQRAARLERLIGN